MKYRMFDVIALGVLIVFPCGAAPKPPEVSDSPARQILARSGLPGGLGVQLGAADTTIARQLGCTGRFVVEVLDPDSDRVGAAARVIQAEALEGLVSVDQHDFHARLPYTEDLVNLLIVTDASGVQPPIEEIRRVLCPHGWVVTAQAGSIERFRAAGFEQVSSFPAEAATNKGTVPRWTMAQKPWPAEIDAWTHPRHAADGNAVSSDRRAGPPRRIRWVVGEKGDTSRMVTAQGRNYYAGILARDSFNGLRLWQREAPSSKQGPAPVVEGDRLYTVVENRLVALQGTSGRIVRDYPEAGTPREILVEAGTLVTVDRQSVRALNAQDGRLLWRRAARGVQQVVAGPDAVYYLEGDPRLGQKRAALAIGRPTGEILWQRDDYPWLSKVQRAVLHGNRLVFEVSTLSDEKKGNQIQVVSAADGSPLWSRDFVPGMNHLKQARAMFIGDRLWVLDHLQGVALDPASGQVLQKYPAGLCHCFPPVATVRYLFSGEMNLTDLASGKLDANRITKAACGRDAGWIPANGLVYVFPKACMCWPMLRGNAALASAESPVARQREETRLETGLAVAPNQETTSPTDWPCYRQNDLRSASTPAAGPDRLRRLWSVHLAARPEGPIADDWEDNPFIRGPITSPVIAGPRVYVARSDAHEIVALEAATGRVVWRQLANGRIDSPPTIYRGLCLFGTHAGWVYCLRADDGRMVWRMRAAPRDERIVAYGQVESPWPVAGSVLVSGGLAYFAAGRHPLADGGMEIFAVEPASGKIVWQKRLDTLPTKDFYASCSAEFECVDLLTRQADQVAMSRWLFDCRKGTMSITESEAFAVVSTGQQSAVVPRSSWTYGPRQNRRHARDYPRRPLLAFAENRVVACGGDFQSVFRRDFTPDEIARFDRKWITGWAVSANGRKPGGQVWPVQRLADGAKWTTRPFAGASATERIVAVVLAGQTVFVAGLEGGVIALSAQDGHALARCDSPTPIWDGLAVAGRKLFLSAADGSLVCYGD